MKKPPRETAPWYTTEGVAGEVFVSRRMLCLRVQSILRGTPPGQCVSDADRAFLLALMARHPTYGAAIAAVDTFGVRVGGGLSAVVDGQWYPVSWRPAVDV